MIELPVDFAADITTNATGLVAALNDPVTLIIGTLLAVVVVGALIGMFRR